MSGTVSNVAAGIQVPPPIDPVQRLGQLAQTGTALTQNQLLNEQLTSRRAQGDAALQAIDPSTGQFSPDQFRRNIAQNPLARFMSMEALSGAAALDRSQEALKIEQAQLGMLRLNNVRQAIGGLVARQDVSAQDVIAEIGRLASLPESERPFSPTMAAQVLATMPHNPAQLREWLISQMARTDAGLAHLQNLLPQGQLVPFGGGTAGVTWDPIRRQFVPTNFSVTNTPTPDQLNEFITVVGPDGRQYRVRNRDATPMVTGNNTPMPGGAPLSTPPGQAQPGGPLGTGRYPAPPAPTAALTAGETAASAVTGEAGGRQVASLNTAAAEVPNMRTMLGNMNTMLDSFEPGPGAGWQKLVQATINRNVPGIRYLGVEFDPKRIASQEEFNKLASQVAQAQFRALGGSGANFQLESAISTSPSETLTREGNRNIIALLRGNNEALAVQQREWQKWAQQNGAGPERYGDFLAQWNQVFDPRVFQAVYASAAGRRQMFQAMSPADQDRYIANFREAVNRGWVEMPAEVRRAAQPTPRPAAAPPRPGYISPTEFGYTGR